MGIKGLTKEIKKMAPSAITIMPYADLAEISKHKVYGVDVFSYLYPTQYNAINKSKGNHIREFMEMISTWASHGIRLIFVFDGNTNSEAKRDCVTDRVEKRIKGQAQVQSLIHDIMETESATETGTEHLIINTDLNKMGHQILSSSKGTAEQRIELEFALKSHVIVSGDKINDLMTLFQLVGATYIQAKGEADFLLASLYKNGYIDGVISEDCDMLTHGIDRLVRGITDSQLRRVGHITVYSLSSILDEAKMSMNQFIDYCILCGCDYCPKISGVAGAIGLRLLRKHSNISNIIQEMRDGTLSHKPANGISIDDYLFKYERAFRIFSREQESLPEFKVGCYDIADGFKEWIMSETNYTIYTLEQKLKILKSQVWSKHEPDPPMKNVEVQVQVPDQVQDQDPVPTKIVAKLKLKLKPTVPKIPVSVTPRIKINPKIKTKTESQS